MCGIAGVWHPVGDLDKNIRTMTGCIRHRGPDAEGHRVFPDAGLALGHRRLSIVDLSPTGAQPMHSAGGRYTIVFNGEIYNFKSLKRELEERGCRFRGTSDTEVMLAAFEEYGVVAAVPKFAGMFAFSLWDNATNEIGLARDRMGEKPLYYSQFGNTFAWASELKSLTTLPGFNDEINPVAVADVLERGYIRGTRTIYSHVAKLKPGALLRVSRSNGAFQLETHTYWSVSGIREERGHVTPTSRKEAADSLESLLLDVIADEMVADVPVGAFLSGGIDSSLVVALMQKVASKPVRTFTVGFEEASVDESAHAKRVATHLGTDHTEIRLSASDALDYVSRLPTIFDEPFADQSALPTLLICEGTRRHVTVALSGDGGDELFGGYSQYMSRDSIGEAIRRVPPFARKLVGAGVGFLPEAAWRAAVSGDTWAPNAKARVRNAMRMPGSATVHEGLLSNWADSAGVMAAPHGAAIRHREWDVSWPDTPTYQEAQMEYDMQTYLPDDIMFKVDRSAMSTSLETRSPLLDHRVVEFAVRQPLAHKISASTGKGLMRDVLSRYVPRDLWERPKQGFAIPLADWLRSDLRSWGESMLESTAALESWFQPDQVRKLWTAHQSGQNHADRLWRILIVLQWLKTRA